CPDKEKFKEFTHMYKKGKPKAEEEKLKDKYTKKTPGRKKNYTKDRFQNKTKEYFKEEKGDAFAKMLVARTAKFEKDKKKAIKEETKFQETFGEERYPRRIYNAETIENEDINENQEYQEYLKLNRPILQ
ncbi:9278_t:CDS:2, partial [Gigaspora margarita]